MIRVGAVGDVGLVAKRIGEYSQITCASPGYIEKYGEPSSPAELDHHVAVGYVMNSARAELGISREWGDDDHRDEESGGGERCGFVSCVRRGGVGTGAGIELHVAFAYREWGAARSAQWVSFGCPDDFDSLSFEPASASEGEGVYRLGSGGL